MRDKIAKYLMKKYGTEPEYLWKRYPRFAVFRHDDNRKWYAVIMNVTPDKIGAMGCDEIDIIDVKIDDLMLRDILLQQEGYYPGYHMNKGNWITIVLDGTVAFDEVCRMIDASYEITASAKKSRSSDSLRNGLFRLIPSIMILSMHLITLMK